MAKMALSLNKYLHLFILLLGLVVLPGPDYADGRGLSQQNGDDVKKIERKLSSEREQLRKVDVRERDLLGEIAQLEEEVTEKRHAIRDFKLNIQKSKAEMEALKRELMGLRKASMEAQFKISNKLVQFYKCARIGSLKTLMDVRDVSDLLRRVKYFNIIVEQDKAALLKAADQAQARQDEMSRIEARLHEIKRINQREQARLRSLKKELDEKVLLLVTIHQEKKFYQTGVQELAAAAERLKETFIRIEKKDAYEADQPCHFDDFKGKLPYPTDGKVLKGAQLPQSGAGGYKGVIIEGPPSSEVRAVFPGKVAFSGRLKGYGDLVIINHGSRYFTVCANLAVRNKIEGEVVKKGDVIGLVASNGRSRSAKLYFEIRRGGEGLNPCDWLKPQ